MIEFKCSKCGTVVKGDTEMDAENEFTIHAMKCVKKSNNSRSSKSMKIKVSDLREGHIIDPPAGEKKWLWTNGVKRLYTVTSIVRGKTTKKGQFIKVMATCPSPYTNEEPFDIDCQMLEDKLVMLR